MKAQLGLAAGSRRIRVTGTLVLATGIGLVAMTGAASAYYRAAVLSTSATGQATVSNDIQPVTIAAATASGTALYPGSAAGDLNFTVTNPNPRPLSITALTLTATGNTTTCALSLSGISFPIAISAVNGASQQVSLSSVLTMGSAAAASCMNQSALSVPVTATVRD